MEAAAASLELNNDGSNVAAVFEKIDGIFSKDASGEEVCFDTLKSRWDRSIARYNIVDESLYRHFTKRGRE
jgi:hypothetical protein